MGEINLKFDTTSTPQQVTHSDSVSLSDYFSDNENGNAFHVVAKVSQYRKAIRLIDRKCANLSRNNEKLVRRLFKCRIYSLFVNQMKFSLIRIHYVKGITKRKEKDILLLKAKLDEYNDEWRTADTSDTLNGNFPSLIRTSTQNKSKKSTIRKCKRNVDNPKSDEVITNGSVKETINKNADTKRKRPKLV